MTTITLHYDEALIRHVTKASFKKGFHDFLWSLFTLFIVTFMWVTSSRTTHRDIPNWLWGLIIVFGFGSFCIQNIILWKNYRRTLQSNLEKLRQMTPPEAEIQLSQERLYYSQNSENLTLPWPVITAVRRYSKFWLLNNAMTHPNALTLPLADLDAEFQAFILDRVRASSGKVV